MFTEITSREIVGMIYQELSISSGAGWVDPLSLFNEENSASVKYGWLGQVPAMRKWVGSRVARQLREHSYTITNEPFEATLDVFVRDLRRDKTKTLQNRISEMILREESHWAQLLSSLLLVGTTKKCYDGKPFFSSTHKEGDSGTQSNNVTASDIADLQVGVATKPTAAEMSDILLGLISHIQTINDDRGELMNEEPRRFLAMAGTPHIYGALKKAVNNDLLSQAGGGPADNVIAKSDDWDIDVKYNPRLSSFDDGLFFFRTDTSVKPFIRQQEGPIDVTSKAEGSDYEHDYKQWQFGIDTSRNVGFGLWQYAIRATMST